MEMIEYKHILFFIHLMIWQVNSGSVAFYDIPMCSDIDQYLDAIESAVTFTKTVSVDDNLGFGLLVLRANWKFASRVLNLPEDVRKRIQWMGKAAESTIFSDTFTLRGAWREDMGITDMFNLTYVPPLNQEKIKSPDIKFPSTAEYIDEIISVDKIAELSDKCLDDFANMSLGDGNVKCAIRKKCLKFAKHGPDYGYAINHRLLLTILTKSRGCYLFDPKEDKRLRHRLCSAIYSESLYLVYNDYISVDLLMESVCLCSSLGYIQFLSRKWISEALSYQSDYGCFESTQLERHSRKKLDIDIICGNDRKYARFLKKNNCDPHFTAVTMAALVVAARYTMQKCYGIRTSVMPWSPDSTLT